MLSSKHFFCLLALNEKNRFKISFCQSLTNFSKKETRMGKSTLYSSPKVLVLPTKQKSTKQIKDKEEKVENCVLQ